MFYQKNFKQKISVMIFGLFLFLLLLEIGLRTGAFLFLSWQEYRNRVSIKQKKTYRIMCLGESVTACSKYASMLEWILNQSNLGITFRVINKGVTSCNSSYILDHLDSNLNEVRPDMVIAMMGINDSGKIKYFDKITDTDSILFKHVRVYKFFRILLIHVVDKFKKENIYKQQEHENDVWVKPSINNAKLKEDRALGPADDNGYIAMGVKYLEESRYSEAEAAFIKAIELNPKNDAAYLELGRSLVLQGGQFYRAMDLCKKALTLNPLNDKAYQWLGNLYMYLVKYDIAEKMFNEAIALNPRNFGAYLGLVETYNREANFRKAEEVLAKVIDTNALSGRYAYSQLGWCYLRLRQFEPIRELLRKAELTNQRDPGIYGLFAVLYERMGDKQLAKEYYKKANKIRIEEVIFMTAQNYQKLKKALDKEGIKLVCVQYPMCSIEPLKKIFKEEQGIIFVDNEKIFKSAVDREGYEEYFIDMFGGDFGHTGLKGDKLLADNIANVILKEVFNK